MEPVEQNNKLYKVDTNKKKLIWNFLSVNINTWVVFPLPVSPEIITTWWELMVWIISSWQFHIGRLCRNAVYSFSHRRSGTMGIPLPSRPMLRLTSLTENISWNLHKKYLEQNIDLKIYQKPTLVFISSFESYYAVKNVINIFFNILVLVWFLFYNKIKNIYTFILLPFINQEHIRFWKTKLNIWKNV